MGKGMEILRRIAKVGLEWEAGQLRTIAKLNRQLREKDEKHKAELAERDARLRPLMDEIEKLREKVSRATGFRPKKPPGTCERCSDHAPAGSVCCFRCVPKRIQDEYPDGFSGVKDRTGRVHERREETEGADED